MVTRVSAAFGVVGLATAVAAVAYMALGAGKADPRQDSTSTVVTTGSPIQEPLAVGSGRNLQPAPVPTPAIAPARSPSSPQAMTSAASVEPAPRPSPDATPAPPVIAAPTTFAPMTPPPAIQSLPAPPPTATGQTTSDASRPISIKKDAVIGVRLDQVATTETARVDDKVTARVARDVVVDGRTAIPTGARLEGVVTLVERGGRSAGRGKIGIRFHKLVLGDNQHMSIQTETIVRDSEPNEPLAAVGARGAVGVIVSGAGRKVPAPTVRPSTPAALTNTQTDARIPAGSLLTVKLTAALTIDTAGGRQ